MSDDPVIPESVPLDGSSPVTFVTGNVSLGAEGSIAIRRPNSVGGIEWVQVTMKQPMVRLLPSDRLVVTGNARCVVFLWADGGTQEAVTQVQCIRSRPEQPVWVPATDPVPSPVDSRFISVQYPPVIDVHHVTVDGVAVQEMFVAGGMVQVEA